MRHTPHDQLTGNQADTHKVCTHSARTRHHGRQGHKEGAVNLTKLSMANPAAVVVVVVLLLILGAVSLGRLPIQLLPNIDQPTINVWTNWRGAAPADMESVIIEQQERVLRNIPGVERTQSGIRQGNGNVLLTFAVGTDMQRAYLDVINRLQQVPALPRDANGP